MLHQQPVLSDRMVIRRFPVVNRNFVRGSDRIAAVPGRAGCGTWLPSVRKVCAARLLLFRAQGFVPGDYVKKLFGNRGLPELVESRAQPSDALLDILLRSLH